ncbi:MAG: hypothetical protein AAFN13_14035, partial [Bacteroidota bacterium]
IEITGLPALEVVEDGGGVVPVASWTSQRLQRDGEAGLEPATFNRLSAYTLAERLDRQGRDLRTVRVLTNAVLTPGTRVSLPGRHGSTQIYVPIGVRVRPDRRHQTEAVLRELAFYAEEAAAGEAATGGVQPPETEVAS